MPQISNNLNIKRIFYSNITYGCNSSCIFCYSHNTRHNGTTFNEISKDSLVEYWNRMDVRENDRIIINGGEPLLHSEINEILIEAGRFNCEVLIYTNGRLLDDIDTSFLDKRYRFVIPIHGYEHLHDEITRVDGSYKETINGLRYIMERECKIDIKIIINYKMATDNNEFLKTVEAISSIPFNNSLHITKMADTRVSSRNSCKSVTPELSASITRKLYDIYKEKCVIKIFDTCIKEIPALETVEVAHMTDDLFVDFKDLSYEYEFGLEKPTLPCIRTCKYKDLCKSAVGEYTVLEVNGDIISIGLE